MNPGASIKPPPSAMDAMAKGADDAGAKEAAAAARDRLMGRGAPGAGIEAGGAAEKTAQARAGALKPELGALRDKLKRKKPSFM